MYGCTGEITTLDEAAVKLKNNMLHALDDFELQLVELINRGEYQSASKLVDEAIGKLKWLQKDLDAALKRGLFDRIHRGCKDVLH